MEVEMVLRQVGETDDVEFDPVHPAQGQGMARHLHRAGVRPSGHHQREQGLQVGRFGGGPDAGQSLVHDPGLHRADQPAVPATPAQRVVQHGGGGGLPVGAGDAEHQQLAGRLAEQPGGQAA
jgi:hypothetical protein